MDKAPRNSKPSSSFTFWVSKSVKFMKNRAKSTNGTSSNRFIFDGMFMNNSLYCASPNCLEAKIEGFVNDNEVIGGKREGLNENEGKIGNFMGVSEEESGESSSGSNFLVSEVTLNDENSSIGDSSSQFSIGKGPYCDSSEVSEENEKSHFNNGKLEKQGSYLSEIEMMKERFSKLLLGEDMSGCGNGVCTALALSNAITNLFATIFGQIWKLEPLPYEKKIMWRREVDWLLSVSDHIVELIPSCQTLPDGNKLEVMTSRPRLDLYINLPALRKLENMLLEILESFESSEFWYVDQGVVASEADGSSTFKKPLPRQEDKWWLPVPRVPPGGLSEDARKLLQYRRDCTNQILKAAMVINSVSLAEMDIPDSYLESLPKSGKASLGDIIHRYINSDQFSPECLLECLDVSSEHQALEIADRVEATIYVWRRRTNSKPPLLGKNRSNSRSSWGMVKDLVKDAVKRELLADRAENLLVCLKQRFPGLPQTTLDTSKIQYNKDVGKSILESYSRVLESLSFNIVARIDDLLYVDDLSKHSDHPVTISKVTSPANMDKSPYIESSKLSLGVFGVKRILTDYLSIDGKGKDLYNNIGRSDSSVSMIKASPSMEFSGCSREGSGRVIDETDEDA